HSDAGTCGQTDRKDMVRGDQELNHDGGEVLSPLHFLPKQHLRCHDGSRQSAFQIARASPTQTEKEPILKTSVITCHTRRSIAVYLFKPAGCSRKSCFAIFGRSARSVDRNRRVSSVMDG